MMKTAEINHKLIEYYRSVDSEVKIFCKPLNDYLGKNYKGPKVSVAALRNEPIFPSF